VSGCGKFFILTAKSVIYTKSKSLANYSSSIHFSISYAITANVTTTKRSKAITTMVRS